MAVDCKLRLSVRGAEVQLTTIFEKWHIADGNYPPLHKGQLVNLSFELQPNVLSKSSSPKDGRFEQTKDAEYSFAGTVLKVYGHSSSTQIVVIQAGDFRFYMNSFPKETPPLKEGDSCEGYGSLMLDHYIWVEFLPTYEDPPDLFYPLRVTRIRSVKIPNEFISRYETGMSGPASLRQEQYSTAAIAEIEQMKSDDEGWLFYLVDLDSSNVGSGAIPLTFRGLAYLKTRMGDDKSRL
jgi:hypothetical protein